MNIYRCFVEFSFQPLAKKKKLIIQLTMTFHYKIKNTPIYFQKIFYYDTKIKSKIQSDVKLMFHNLQSKIKQKLVYSEIIII